VPARRQDDRPPRDSRPADFADWDRQGPRLTWDEPDRRDRWDDRHDRHDDHEPWPACLPGRGLTVATVLLLALCVVTYLVSLGVTAVLLPRVEDQPIGSLDEDDPLNMKDPNQAPFAVVDCVYFTVFLPTALVFCVWAHRTYRNLLLMRVADLEYAPGWTVGAFFIPLVNLVLPYLVYQEMWRASEPGCTRFHDRGWKHTGHGALVICWWLVCVVLMLLTFVGIVLAQDPFTLMGTTLRIGLGTDALGILAGALALAMVWGLRARQEAKFQAMNVGVPREDRED
jgi:hypothetical protein